MTLPSAGYGDMVPKTSSGELVGYVTMLIGMIAMSLPISVIVSRLNMQYNEVFGVRRQTAGKNILVKPCHAMSHDCGYPISAEIQHI